MGRKGVWGGREYGAQGGLGRTGELQYGARGVPRTSSAKKGGDPECMLRGLRGRRVQGPVPSGPARGDPARTQLGWGAFRTARGL
jgi:hypothetical protein